MNMLIMILILLALVFLLWCCIHCKTNSDHTLDDQFQEDYIKKYKN